MGGRDKEREESEREGKDGLRMRVKEEMIKKTEEVPRELTKVGVYIKVNRLHTFPAGSTIS